MKYIKLFENLYYSEISIDEYESLISYKSYSPSDHLNAPFNEDELDKISKSIGHYSLKKVNPYFVRINLGDLMLIGNILKDNDEWFYLYLFSNSEKTWKCDQLEGLLKCIKDNI